MAKIKKTPASKQVEKKQEELSELDIQRSLFSQLDALVDSTFLDRSLDEKNEKDFLSRFPTLIGPKQSYKSKFELDFYRHIFRLRGWPIESDKSLRRRPGIVAKITNYLIYKRFPEGTLEELQKLNSDRNEDGNRLFKHHQWLTAEGIDQLKKFLKEATDLMAECKNWNQFIKLFSQKIFNPLNLKWTEK